MLASRPTEAALELGALGHGLFTHSLLEGLRGAADRDRDRTVTLQELYDYVEAEVRRTARSVGRDQHPVLKGELAGAVPLIRLPP